METDLKVRKALAKIAVDSQKLATKRALPDVSSAPLVSVYLRLAVQKSKAIEGIPDLVLFVNGFVEVVADISILEISFLLRSNIKLASKWAVLRFLVAYS